MFWRRRMEEDLERDIQEHIAIETDDNIARGMSPEEARYAALRKFGNVARTIEDTRDVWVWNWLDTLSGDVRQAFRRVRKSPGTSALVVLSLALAFIPSVTLFAFMDRILLTPIPVRDPQELVEIQLRNLRPDAQFRFSQVSYLEARDFERSLRTVSGLAYGRGRGVIALLNGRRTLHSAVLVNDNYFTVLGIPLQLAAGYPHDRHSLVISHSLWQREFGGRSDAINQTVLLNGQQFTIGAIAGPEFQGMARHLTVDFWVPFETWVSLQPQLRGQIEGGRDVRECSVYGRLRHGVTMAQAAAEVEGIARRFAQDWPETNKDLAGFTYDGVGERTRVGRMMTAIGVLLLGVVLAVACANVAGVLLARTEERRHETAVRQALGASRFRLIRAWMVESVVLAAIASMLGLVGARALVDFLPGLLPPMPIPIHFEFPLGPRVWAYMAVMMGVSVLFFGLVPAWQGSRPDVVGGLRRDAAVRFMRIRIPVRNLLIVGQIAAAEVLLFAGGLVLSNLWSTREIDPGIDPNRAVALALLLPATQDGDARPMDREMIAARLSQIGGVRRATYGHTMPLSGMIGPTHQMKVADHETRSVYGGSAGPGFLSMLGVKIFAGRDLRESDQHSILVNMALARLLDPSGNAVGRQIRVDGKIREIVGVFQDAGWRGVRDTPQPRLIALDLARGAGDTTFAIEVAGDPRDYLTRFRTELSAALPDGFVLSARSLSQHYEDALFGERISTQLLYGLGLVALLLTATGLHGITRTLFARRTREFSIRLALGASPRQIVRTVISSSLSLAGAGLILGLAIAVPIAVVVGAQMHGFAPWSVAAWGFSSAIVTGAALVAAAQPAWRVLAIRPADALRSE